MALLWRLDGGQKDLAGHDRGVGCENDSAASGQTHHSGKHCAKAQSVNDLISVEIFGLV